MKISQVRQLLEKYSKLTRCSGGAGNAKALEEFSRILAPVDKKTVALVVKKLSEAKKNHVE